MIRGNLLQKSEIAYSKAISEAVALRSSQLVALHREQIRLMQELEEQALREESKSHHDFLSTYQTALHHSPATPQGEFGYLLSHLTGAITSIASIHSICQGIPSGRTTTNSCLTPASTQMIPLAKKVASYARATGEHVYR